MVNVSDQTHGQTCSGVIGLVRRITSGNIREQEDLPQLKGHLDPQYPHLLGPIQWLVPHPLGLMAGRTLQEVGGMTGIPKPGGKFSSMMLVALQRHRVHDSY
ncbi:unnamed protein product [Pleuronectes platessa]|uniref:Uncharacterized protein n=1 Tax=Pleuronectes platessa TaxID=8262 RepID=A0A9N7VM95_PLEPL|nr:unnamed protein product [Pleuronectes platessa]